MKKYKTEIFLIVILILIITGIKFLVLPLIEFNKKEKVIIPEVKKVWGLSVDSLRIDTLKVRPNQSLSDILCQKGISCSVVDNLARNSKGVFDVRRIKSGNNYYLISKKTSIIPSYFIYEATPVEYYKFELSDSFTVEKGQKEVNIKRVNFCGEIESSLWNTFVDQGADPILAVELSDIFAWTVDFFGIQKGDRFKVIYDQICLIDQPIGLGKIYAASFESGNDKITAYLFNKEGQKGYFDEKGNSLKKAFLKAPLIYSRISSKFSHNRFHPVLKIHRPHHGIDYAAPTGTPVYSIGEGVVTRKAYEGVGGGNYINIKHNSSYSSQYMHLNKFANGIEQGMRVKQGQLIGFVGSTGIATGPHLDFRVYQNNVPINPLKVNAPPVEPVSKANMPDFVALRDSLSKELESISVIAARKNILVSK